MNLPSRRTSAARSLLLAAALLGGAGHDAAAQLPGDPIFARRTTLRGEFLEKTLADVKRALDRWRDAFSADRRRPTWEAVMVPDASFSPLAGWLALGPAAADSLQAVAPRVSGYGFSILDFDASGSMAFVYASVHYQLATATGQQLVLADASIVLVERGSSWKVRSYLERPRPDVP